MLSRSEMDMTWKLLTEVTDDTCEGIVCDYAKAVSKAHMSTERIPEGWNKSTAIPPAWLPFLCFYVNLGCFFFIPVKNIRGPLLGNALIQWLWVVWDDTNTFNPQTQETFCLLFLSLMSYNFHCRVLAHSWLNLS